MGIPVTYDDEGRPVSPRWADVPEAPMAENREGTDSVRVRLRKWLAKCEECFARFAEDAGCETDVILLLMAGAVSQDAQIVADAMEKSPRWVRPRVKRLRRMGMWQGGVTLGSRFSTWHKAITGEFAVTDETEVYIGMVLDILKIDGMVESQCDASGEPLFRLREVPAEGT